MKPGYKSTEFWITVGTKAIAILAVLGVFHGDVNSMQAAWVQMVTAAVAVAGSIITAVHYISVRTDLKSKEKSQ